MEFKVVADYVVPGSKRISVGGAASLSTAQMHRQHISGKPLMDAIHEALLQGMGSRNQLAAWHDLARTQILADSEACEGFGLMAQGLGLMA